MVVESPWLGIERFDYVPLDDHLALVRLLARRATELRRSEGAWLWIEQAVPEIVAQDRLCVLERHRRLLAPSQQLWGAEFTLPLELVESPATLFELCATGCAGIAILAPGLRPAPPARAAAQWLSEHAVADGRRRAAAAATALALLGSPAVSLAASIQPSAPAAYGSSVAQAATASQPGTSSAAAPVTAALVAAAPVAATPLAAAPAASTSTAPTSGGAPVATAPAPTAPAPTAPAPTAPAPNTPAPTTPAPTATAPTAPTAPAPTAPASTEPASTAPAPKRHTSPKPIKVTVSQPAHRHTKSRSHVSGGASIVPPKHSHTAPKAPSSPSSTPAAPVVSTPAPVTTGSTAIPTADAQMNAALAHLSVEFGKKSRQPPAFLVPIYKAAAHRYHVPWRILAAINLIESDYGRNVSTSSAGAVGWMQFMPATWSEYGVRVGGRGAPNPYDPRDAIFAAAKYLAANGARHDLKGAIFAYNHATWYVDEVLTAAAEISNPKLPRSRQARRELRRMWKTALRLDGDPYIWGGGHGGWEPVAGYDCSGFVSKVLHSAGYLAEPVTTEALPSQSGIVAGPGRYVTIFDRTGVSAEEGHVIIDIDGQWWESGGSSAAGGSASVHPIFDISPEYLATFNTILHPRGL